MSAHGFWSRVAGTFAANLALMALGAVSAIVTARVLGPDGRGAFAVLMTVTLIGVQFGHLGLTSANTYFAAADKTRLPALLGNSLLFAAGLGATVAAVLYGIAAAAPAVIPAGIGNLLPLAILAIPFAILLLLVQHLFLGAQDIRRYNGLQLLQSASVLLLLLLLAAFGFATAGNFYLAVLAALVATTAVGVRALLRAAGGVAWPARELVGATLRYGARTYSATFFAFVVLHFDLLMVAKMLGSGPAGLYSIAARLAEMIYLLPAVVGTMLFATVPALGGQPLRFARQTAATVAVIMVPVVLVAGLLAKPAVPLLFGVDFSGAVPAFVWLLPGVYLLGVNTVFMQYFAGIGMPWIAIASPGAAAALNIVLNLFFIPRVGIEGAAIASSISYGLMLVASIIYVSRPVPAKPGTDENLEQAPQDIYGHNKRLDWMLPHLRENDTIVELGCGTGYMLTYPLVARGYNAHGIDLDANSIALGRDIFRAASLDPRRLRAGALEDFPGPADVVIASEVLEHVHTTELPKLLAAIRGKLKPDGRLYVTVPNGYGWFEAEQFIWQRLYVGRILERLRFVWLLLAMKTRVLGSGYEARHPATLDGSPHVQRFTAKSVRRLLEDHGFEVEHLTGSVAVAGPFSHLLFSGIDPLMRANCWFGERFPHVAAGFYVACKVAPAEERGRRKLVAESDVLGMIVQRKLADLPKAPLEIRAHDLDLAIGRDVVDLALRLRGRDWIWSDRHGRTAPPVGMARAAGALVREAVWQTPADYVRHRRRVARLEADASPHQRAISLERALFLRSDHAFGIAAGGSVGHLAGVIQGFRHQGIDVHVASSDVLADVAVADRFQLIKPEYGSARNFSELIKLNYNTQLLQELAAHWRAWRPDFVYHRYSMFNYVAPALRARYGVPHVCEYNGPFAWMQRNWENRPLLLEGMAERIEGLNLRAADLVVVVSRALLDAAVERGADRDRVLVNPNGVDVTRYAPSVSGDGVRRRYGLEDAIVVGFIGTIGPWHGVEKLVEAAALLFSRPDPLTERIRFLVIGDGARMTRVRELVQQAGVADRVILTGLIPQDQGPTHLAACDILASPHVPNPDGTEFFGSPTKLFEYMAMGRAIVASRLGQIGEVLDHGKTAWLVPPAEPDALAEAIRVLAAEPALRARLGAHAREVAVREYTWDAHSRRIIDALEQRVCEPREARQACTA